jgi:hypothetical protein
MEGDPAQFEVIGSRLGFSVEADGPEKLTLVWQGARFPSYLCLGVAAALLFLSVPIVEAIRLKGLEGPAASLWYFPVMNLILLGISVFLLSLKRIIVLDQRTQQIVLRKRSIFHRSQLSVGHHEVTALRLGFDQVYSGFAVAGSSAAQRYPVPSLRLVLKGGATVLLDRGGMRRLKLLGQRLSDHLGKPLRTEEVNGRQEGTPPR